MKKHIKCVVLKQRPFKCDSCQRAFGERSNLTRHIRAVQYVRWQFPTSANTLVDDVGANLACQPSVLCIVHPRSGKETSHNCQSCGLQFNSRDSLAAHVRTQRMFRRMCGGCGGACTVPSARLTVASLGSTHLPPTRFRRQTPTRRPGIRAGYARHQAERRSGDARSSSGTSRR